MCDHENELTMFVSNEIELRYQDTEDHISDKLSIEIQREYDTNVKVQVILTRGTHRGHHGFPDPAVVH